MEFLKCVVCNSKTDAKYKCPSCLVRYCSKSCYETHKNSETCEKQSVEYVKPPRLSKFSNISIRGVIPLAKLEGLRYEKPLLDLLKNPHLRNLLLAINNADNPEEIMHKAMQEPLFTEFADVCLKKLDPPSDDET